jgi:hypothetical protein
VDPNREGLYPLSERILDRLGDILLASDEILWILAEVPALSSVERSIRHVYDEVNELMKELAD